MSKIIFISILSLFFLACNSSTEKEKKHTSSLSDFGDGIILKKFEGLTITGDFDGDKKQDTIIQRVGSTLKKVYFEKIVDPLKNHWDIVTNWHFNRGTDLCLFINRLESEELRLGSAQGLYCLINIGDNNNDGKDEIAFVVDNLDYSRVNSCKIYTICETRWTLLKQFGVLEDAFDFTGQQPLFTNVKGFLEKQDSKWVYKDYSEDEYENKEAVGKMLPLKLEQCR